MSRECSVLELVKRLECEVLEYVERLSGQSELQFAGETVDLSQFLGLELNPRTTALPRWCCGWAT